jgi:hypothetical protein
LGASVAAGAEEPQAAMDRTIAIASSSANSFFIFHSSIRIRFVGRNTAFIVAYSDGKINRFSEYL